MRNAYQHSHRVAAAVAGARIFRRTSDVSTCLAAARYSRRLRQMLDQHARTRRRLSLLSWQPVSYRSVRQSILHRFRCCVHLQAGLRQEEWNVGRWKVPRWTANVGVSNLIRTFAFGRSLYRISTIISTSCNTKRRRAVYSRTTAANWIRFRCQNKLLSQTVAMWETQQRWLLSTCLVQWRFCNCLQANCCAKFVKLWYILVTDEQ